MVNENPITKKTPKEVVQEIINKTILSYNDFGAKDIYDCYNYGNFSYYFKKAIGGPVDAPSAKRKDDVFLQFKDKHKLKHDYLIKTVQEIEDDYSNYDSLGEAIHEECAPEMYEAYQIMREYGASDYKLFL